jgi:hypothetical protein
MRIKQIERVNHLKLVHNVDTVISIPFIIIVLANGDEHFYAKCVTVVESEIHFLLIKEFCETNGLQENEIKVKCGGMLRMYSLDSIINSSVPYTISNWCWPELVDVLFYVSRAVKERGIRTQVVFGPERMRGIRHQDIEVIIR